MLVVINDLDVEVASTFGTPAAPATSEANEPTADQLGTLASHLAARHERVRAD